MQLENILQNEVLVNNSPNIQNYRIWGQPSPQNGFERSLRAIWSVEAQQDLRAWHTELMSTIYKESRHDLKIDWKKEGF